MKAIKYFLVALFACMAMSCTDHIITPRDGGDDDDPPIIIGGGGPRPPGSGGGGGRSGGSPLDSLGCRH